MINYYEILEVSQNASKEVIEKAYKVLAKKYHPDLNPDSKKEAENKMKKINEAYDVLIDDKKRENYDFVLKKKQELESKRQSQSTGSSKSVDNSEEPNNTVSYSNTPYVDEDNNFVINTYKMDKKTQNKIQKKLQEKYLEAYDEYLRSQGYKLKYKWTFKRVLNVLIVILTTIIVFTILYFIPPINKYCHELYNNNFIVKILTDLVVSIFTTIGNIFF